MADERRNGHTTEIDLRRTGRELQDVQDGVHLSSGGRDSSDTE